MPRYPNLYQINTRVHLNRLSKTLGRPATLDDISDGTIEGWTIQRFDWIYLLGVWPTGPQARRVALSHPGLQEDYRRLLPDLTPQDVCGSCFAIADYHVADSLGGNAALLRFRERLNACGIRLMLDFVPNHVGLDHAWVWQHPEYFIHMSQAELSRAPQNGLRIDKPSSSLNSFALSKDPPQTTSPSSQILAYGRDPYFDGWSDTLQLNYAEPGLQAAMQEELLRIAPLCDGLRCDMAMLVLPEVFERTWGLQTAPFWPEAIACVRGEHPNFVFMAEVYWDMEAALLEQGFDYCYDKGLYDSLVNGWTPDVRQHLLEHLDYLDHLVHFLENHDELRAAEHFKNLDSHKAAAILTYTIPGMRFFHQGQLDGYTVKLPVQLCRAPEQFKDEELLVFYNKLLATLTDPVLREGAWGMIPVTAEGDESIRFIRGIAYSWSPSASKSVRSRQRLLCLVNYSHLPGRFFIHLSWDDLAGRSWRFSDNLSSFSLSQDGGSIVEHGLQVELPAWGAHVFSIHPA